MEYRTQFFSQEQDKAKLTDKLLIVPTRKLATELEADWQLWQQSQGKRVWPMLKIRPWVEYMEALASHISDEPLVSETQRQYLWHKVSEQLLEERDDILSSRSIIATWLMDAEGLIVDYALGDIPKAYKDDQNSVPLKFVEAAIERADTICSIWQRSCMSSILKRDGAIKLLGAKWRQDKAVFIGFEQLTPLQQAVSGSDNHIPTAIAINKGQYCSYPNANSEMDSVLIEASDLAKKDKKIAIIVADLGQRYQSIKQRIHLLGLSPDLFHITASAPLADHPIVQSLMRHISIVLGFERDANVYLDWYADTLVDSIDYFRRMRVFIKLKDEIISNFNLAYLRAWLIQQDQSYHDLMPWLDAQGGVEQYAQQLKSERAIVAWHEFIESLLQSTHWGKGAVFDSEATQAIEAFQKQLKALSDIDLFGERFNAQDYWQLLQRRLKAESFQVKAAQAPISISGWREVGGLVFDEIFVVNQHSMSWPPSQSPNPLLPLKLQKDYAMNGQGEDSQLGADATARALLMRLKDTKSQVQFSFGLKEGEEARQSAHQLTKAISQVTKAAEHTPTIALMQQQIKEDDPLALTKGEHLKVRAIDAMFQCPYIALAEHRMGLKWQRPLTKGVPKFTIGMLVDATMRYLVPKIDDIRQQKLDEAAAVTFISTKLKSLLGCQLGFIGNGQIEGISKRILAQALTWIGRYDKAEFSDYRDEEIIEGSINGQPLRGRIDRHDSIAGTPRIIDYKSGSKSNFTHNMWNIEALKDLQLPIYAVITQELAQIGIAHISLKNEVGFYSAQLDRAMLDEYQRLIHDLAGRYIEGDYPLSPRTTNQCKNCQFALICRQDIWLGDEEDE